MTEKGTSTLPLRKKIIIVILIVKLCVKQTYLTFYILMYRMENVNSSITNILTYNYFQKERTMKSFVLESEG